MTPDKSILIEQINAIIEESSASLNANAIEMGAIIRQSDNLRLTDPDNPVHAKDPLFAKLLQSVTGLEQRVESVEKLNEHLLYFIHYMYENFSTMVEGSKPEPPRSSHTVKRQGTIAQRVTHHQNHQQRTEPSIPEITRRESEVLHLLSQGLCVKEIATELFISENTVVTHKKKLKEKFQARNTVDLISRAFNISK